MSGFGTIAVRALIIVGEIENEYDNDRCFCILGILNAGNRYETNILYLIRLSGPFCVLLL